MTLKAQYNYLQLKTFFRPLFAALAPILYAILILFFISYFFNNLEERKATDKRELWAEKARAILATIQSNHDLTQIIQNVSNKFALLVEKNYSKKLDIAYFASMFQDKLLSALPVKPAYCWAFTIDGEKAKTITHPLFENSRRKIMEIVFNTFLKFSGSDKISQKFIAEKEKFIKKILGNSSSPFALGRLRQGIPTPIKFAGQNYYMLWRKYSSGKQVFAGVILLFPAKEFSNREAGLRHICEEIYQNSGHKLAVAFVPTKEFLGEKAIIIPESFNQYPKQKKIILDKLRNLKSFPLQLKPEITIDKDFVYLRSLYSLNHTYDAVIFASAGVHFFPKSFPFPATAVGLLLLWLTFLAYYYKKYGRFHLPLTISFRLIFFLSGLFPVTLLLIIGQNLLRQQLDANISELTRLASEQLAAIEQRSDILPNLFGLTIRKIISRPYFQKKLKNLKIDELEPVFREIHKEIQRKQLDLNAMFAFAPGQSGRMYISDPRDYKDTKGIFDFMAILVFEISKGYQLISGKQSTLLYGGRQNTWYKSVATFNTMFQLQKIFLDTIEKENSISLARASYNYFYSTVVLENDSIKKFLTFMVTSESIFRNFLRQELALLNVNSSFIFFATQIQSNSDISLFPFKKMNVLNSVQGKTALEFMKKSRKFIFPQTFTSKDFLYLFHPISKMKKYAIGCIVSLTAAKLSYDLKMLFLFIFAFSLILLMYFLSAIATSYFIEPIKEINLALAEINRGNLHECGQTDRKDELGLLITTLNLMLKGFKKRIQLGKFVSATLDSSIKNFTDTEIIKKPEFLTGTVLFSDIRNFTTISEKHPPEIVAQMLNSHLDAMSIEIQLYGGKVEQFIGDAIVAVFFDHGGKQSDSIDAAINAAIAMRLRHDEIQRNRKKKGLFGYEIGIGIEHGELTTGMISTGARSEFIVLGQARVMAEQLETNSKYGKFSRIVTSAFVKEHNTHNLNFEKLNGSEYFELHL